MAASNDAGSYEEQLEQLEADERHDMAIVNGAIKRKASHLAFGALFWILAAFALVSGGILSLHTATHISSGLAVGGVIYLAPTWETRQKLKRHYEIERKEIMRSARVEDL